MKKFTLICLVVLLLFEVRLGAEESQIFGTCVHFGFGRGQLDASMSMIKQTGFDSVRDEYSWTWAEYVKGKYNFSEKYLIYLKLAERHQLVPLNMLGYASPLYDKEEYPRSPEAVNAYAAYGIAVMQTQPEVRRLVQVWNEWEGGTGMKEDQRGKGDIPAYITLLKTAYAKIKAADPKAVVISNAFQKFQTLDEAVKLGLLRYCNGAAIHTYNYFHGIGANAESWNGSLNATILPLLRDKSGRGFPLYITEMGWPTSLVAGRGVSQEYAAQQFARLYILARQVNSLKGLWVYDFIDDGWNAWSDEDNFGQLRPDLTPKPSWYVWRDLLNNMKETSFTGQIDTMEEKVHAVRFRDVSQNDTLALWSSSGDDEWQVIVERDGSPISVSVNHAGYPSFQREWDNKISFTLNGLPLFIKGKIGKIRVSKVIRRPYPDSLRGSTPVMKLTATASIAVSRQQSPSYVELKPAKPWCGDKGWHGPDDFMVKYAIQYDRKNLYFEFVITDDVTVKGRSGNKMPSNGDKFILNLLASENAEDPGRRCELGIIQTVDGSRVYPLYVGAGKAAGKAYVRSILKNKEMRCSVVVPCSLFGVEELQPGKIISMGMAVYDYDTPQEARYTICRQNEGNNILLLK